MCLLLWCVVFPFVPVLDFVVFLSKVLYLDLISLQSFSSLCVVCVATSCHNCRLGLCVGGIVVG